MSDLYSEVERFLIREADLLDARRYEEWLALYDEDAWYWVPTHPAATDRRFATAHINDDHQLMQVRVQRLGQDNAYTEQPPSRSVRIVRLVEVEPSKSGAEDYVAVSKLLMYEYRMRQFREDDQRTFGATVRHGLRKNGAGFRIAWKRIDLVNSEASFTAMGQPF
jgi:3-phenylpropionate/cinnamic acid dioxygenase small subunit